MERKTTTEPLGTSTEDFSCTCMQRTTTGLPCIHVVAVTQQEDRSKYEYFKVLLSRVHKCYLRANYKKAYGGFINNAYSASLTANDIKAPLAVPVMRQLLGKRLRSNHSLHSGKKKRGQILHGCNKCNNSTTCIHMPATDFSNISRNDKEQIISDLTNTYTAGVISTALDMNPANDTLQNNNDGYDTDNTETTELDTAPTLMERLTQFAVDILSFPGN